MRILVISEGPPPLGSTVSEGGALRAWGLAKGLASNGHTVTLAYRSSFNIASDASKTKIPKRVTITTWNGDLLSDLISGHQVVVLRYAMGEAGEIIKHLTAEHILVADSYIPISVEVAARKSNDPNEDVNYLRLQKTSAAAMRRADYILYASPAQKLYYLGYLSGINKLNPKTYGDLDKRILEIPYGVDINEKPQDIAKPPVKPTLLWYGAFYSWFDMEVLIPSLLELKNTVPNFKLLIAGAKNPYNQDPGLLAHYEKTTKALSVLGDTIEYLPWTAFDKRFDIYQQASAIITYNHEGLENLLAWRTRLMDFVLADRPILTNAGDPLGEDLIQRGVAYRVTPGSLAKKFKEVIEHPPKKTQYETASQSYDWTRITKTLSRDLNTASRMPEGLMVLKPSVMGVAKTSARKLLATPKRAHKYAKKHGVRKTAKRIIKK